MPFIVKDLEGFTICVILDHDAENILSNGEMGDWVPVELDENMIMAFRLKVLISMSIATARDAMVFWLHEGWMLFNIAHFPDIECIHNRKRELLKKST